MPAGGKASIFLQRGDGEPISDEGGLGVTLLADLEPIGIAEIRSPPGGAVPPAHVHRLHGEGFLDLHVPSCGFGDFMRGRNPNFDQVPAPEDRSTDPSGVLVRSGTTAQSVEVSGSRIAFLADAHETGGALGAIEFTAPHAFAGPPLHVHREFHDVVVVLEGALDVRLDEGRHTAGPGAFVLVPPGAAHTFSNPSDAPLRFLNLYVPGGLERFFRERAETAEPGGMTSRYDWERA